jgi:2'-5' RNA ligase
MTDEVELSRRWAPTLYAPQVPTDRHDKWPVTEEAVSDQDQPFQSMEPQWEDAVNAASQNAPHTGVMVAFYPTAAQQQEMALSGGEPAEDLHLTLAFLGEVGAELQPEDEAKVIAAVTAWAETQQPLDAVTNGHGIFATGPTPVTYASVDSPQLPAARQSLVEALDKAGVPSTQTHGYVPHVTLAYDERRDVQVPSLSLRFDTVVVAFAGTKTRIPLGVKTVSVVGAASLSLYTAAEMYDRVVAPSLSGALYTTGSTGTAATFQVGARPTDMSGVPLLTPQATEETAKAFVTEVNGRTLITGPATTLAAMKDPTVEDITEQHMLWMHGRFVGAETPNRNGALWSAGDLEMAKGTVVNGPLNWLHDARHVIGTLAKADYVDPSKTGRIDAATGGPLRVLDPHITATAAIWKWIYPDEAYVIQQASEQQMLWYSMECISKEVSCVGEGGCGNTTTYSAYMAGAACEHVRQRASVRRFVSPVFLGGAVIVPPTRPGWAEADARVMSTANSLAEAAFEQAGRPDITATQWEQLMGQLVRFAEK